MLIAFIVLYLIGTVALGWHAARRVKTSADFAVAGKQLPLFMASCALFATWFGSETVLGASSEFVSHGLIGVIEDPFGAALCLLLAGRLIARPLYKLNLLTFSDFFRLRYNRSSEIVSAIFMAPSYFSWIAAQLIALAIILQTVAGIDRELGVAICTVIVVFYTFLGGMWSVAVTDLVQTIVIIIGLVALAIDVVVQVGGLDVMIASAPPDFFRFFPTPEPTPIIHWIAAWMTIGLGSIAQQDIFQRVMASKTARTAEHACYWSAGMYLSVAFLPLLIAYGGRILYPELMQGDIQMLLPTMVLQHGSLTLQVLFFGALLSAILSTCSGAMLAPATVIGENLVKPMVRSISDAGLLRVMRWSVAGVGVVTGAMAMTRGNIYELVGESSVFSLVSLFVPLLAGLYWKKATATGAILSMIFGMLGWITSLWLIGDGAENGNIWIQIPPMLYGLVASALGMLAGSLVFRNPPAAGVSAGGDESGW
jgi:SSS family solute:Na+ symporter